MSHIHLYISRGRKELQTPDSDVYIVLEQYVDTMALYVSPFVLRHHQSVFAASQYLAHGLSVGVRYRRFGLVAVVFLCDELSANVDADFVNGIIVDLLHMESVVDNMGVIEHFRGYEHH